MTDLEAVCFDLDDTLCVDEQTDEEIHEAVFDRVDREPFFTPADVHAVDRTEIADAESDREFYENLYRAVARDVGADPDCIPELARATVEVIDHGAVSFREGAREVFERARQDYEVGLVTNGSRAAQTAKLEALGIADDFDAVVFCDPANDVDLKPHPEPFRRVVEELGVAPEETLYVGDWHGGDVVGAHEAGLRSAWVPVERTEIADPDPEPHYRLASMQELGEIL